MTRRLFGCGGLFWICLFSLFSGFCLLVRECCPPIFECRFHSRTCCYLGWVGSKPHDLRNGFDSRRLGKRIRAQNTYKRKNRCPPLNLRRVNVSLFTINPLVNKKRLSVLPFGLKRKNKQPYHGKRGTLTRRPECPVFFGLSLKYTDKTG